MRLEHILVEDAVQRDAIVLNSDLTVAEAVEFIRRYEFTTFPVVDDDLRCVGTITEMRLRRNLVNKNGEALIGEVSDSSATIFSDEPLSQAVLKMDEAACPPAFCRRTRRQTKDHRNNHNE